MPKGRRSSARKATARVRRTRPVAVRTKAPQQDERRQVVAETALSRVRTTIDLGRIIDTVGPKPKLTLRVPVRRPDDLLVFDVIFANLKLVPGAAPWLERVDNTATLTIEFPPQSFGEEAFLEAAAANGDPVRPGDEAIGASPIPSLPQLPTSRIRMAGRSRIVLSMPSDRSKMRFDLASVLEALRTWEMRLDVNATPDPNFGIWDVTSLLTATSTASWKTTAAELAAGVTGFNPGITEALAQSAARVAEYASVSLRGGTQEDLHSVLSHQMKGELDRATDRFPGLREAAGRDAAMALLALQAVEQIARHQGEVAFDIVGSSVLPFLPLLLGPHEPPRSVTALELPYRLMLSPVGATRWQHADAPVERHGRTELWHTRLRSAAGDTGGDGASRVRALWSPDYGSYPRPFAEGSPPDPPILSLDRWDRDFLVRLMSGFDQSVAGHGKQPSFSPRTSEARRLHLSALGALLDAEGSWDTRPEGVDLTQWRHLATLGRDHYVRVMYAGYLCPFGHAASLIKITERKFQPLPGKDSKKRVAVLRQRYYILVREHVKAYSGAQHLREGRNFPFRQVEILTRITPDLYPPGTGPSKLKDSSGGGAVYAAALPRQVFWPMVPSASGASDFVFDLAATDIAGNRVVFAMPLLFVSETPNKNAATIGVIKGGYNAAAVEDKRRADTGSVTIAYAPFSGSDKGDPRLPTKSITFSAGDLKAFRKDTPNFHPEVAGAEVGIKAVQKMLGLADFVQPVIYPDVYKLSGFNPAFNAGEVFLQLAQVANLNFGGAGGEAKSDALGGLASPQMAILGLSRVAGPVSGTPPAVSNDAAQIQTALQTVVDNTFNPTEFFQGAKFLGGVELSKILTVATSLAGDDVPKMLSRERDFPPRVEASFDWKTAISQSDPLKLILPNADELKSQTMLEMHGVVTTPLDGMAEASFSATATLNNFKVNLFGFIIVWFELLSFVAKKGQKPDVQVTLRDGVDAVQFGGPLEFVNTLRELIPSNGFSDPPSLSVTPSGISAGYSLTLPAIQVGIFALSNASLGAAFNLPFDSKPASVKFNFSEREHPFSLTVSLLGGGGFFAIGVSTRGVTEIEAALEFGAAVAIDLGVASGSVEVKAGIYFHWLEPEPDKGSIDLAGYVRIHGELTVIAIISVSLTFNLQLGYHKEAGKSTMYGEATLVVEVEVLFISKSVSVSCRREFGGSKSDPKFIALVPTAAQWSEYCNAFAPDGP